jgi:hypothetical protein
MLLAMVRDIRGIIVQPTVYLTDLGPRPTL